MLSEQVLGREKQAQSKPLTISKSRTGHRDIANYHRFSLFRDITPQNLTSIVDASEKRDFSRVHQLLDSDKCCDHVVLLTSGFVKIVQNNSKRAPTILRLSGPGELIGVLGLLPSKTCQCSIAVGLMPSTALVWKGRVFESLLRKYPILARNTQVMLSGQVNHMVDRLREISNEHAASRLARQMIQIMNQVGYPTDHDVEISISREEIAQLIGANMSTVSRLLADWTKRGIVRRRRGKLTIRNLQVLIELSQRSGRHATSIPDPTAS